MHLHYTFAGTVTVSVCSISVVSVRLRRSAESSKSAKDVALPLILPEKFGVNDQNIICAD